MLPNQNDRKSRLYWWITFVAIFCVLDAVIAVDALNRDSNVSAPWYQDLFHGYNICLLVADILMFGASFVLLSYEYQDEPDYIQVTQVGRFLGAGAILHFIASQSVRTQRSFFYFVSSDANVLDNFITRTPLAILAIMLAIDIISDFFHDSGRRLVSFCLLLLMILSGPFEAVIWFKKSDAATNKTIVDIALAGLVILITGALVILSDAALQFSDHQSEVGDRLYRVQALFLFVGSVLHFVAWCVWTNDVPSNDKGRIVKLDFMKFAIFTLGYVIIFLGSDLYLAISTGSIDTKSNDSQPGGVSQPGQPGSGDETLEIADNPGWKSEDAAPPAYPNNNIPLETDPGVDYVYHQPQYGNEGPSAPAEGAHVTYG